MREFTKGRMFKGLVIALINALIFIALPLALKFCDISFYGVSVTVDETFVNKWILCGIPITIISFFTGYYEKGNLARFYATLIQVIVVIASIFYIFNVQVDNIISIKYGDISVTIGLAIMGILVFIAIVKSLKIVTAYLDYVDYKEEYETKSKKKSRKNKLLDKLKLIDEEKEE